MAKRKATAPTAGDGADLLAAIRARPDEDTPRLIYADWLDENQQPERAEFIRVQCALTRGSEYDANRAGLLLREKLLLTDAHKKAWGELPVKPVKEKTFARGFVDRLSMRAEVFLKGADELFAAIPLRALRPLDVWGVWEQFLASPQLSRLRALDLHKLPLNRKNAALLAGCQHLASIHELNLGANRTIRAEGLYDLLESPYLRELRTLHLNDCDLGDDALVGFVGCTTMPNLRHLNLQGNGIGPVGAAHLARAEWLSQLDRLDIAHQNSLCDAGVRALVDAGLLARNTLLDLRYVGLTVEGLRAIGRSNQLGAVRELRVTANGGDVLEAVAESPAFEHLSALLLYDGAQVTETGVRALLRSPLAARLSALSIHHALRPTAFRELLTAPEMGELRWLLACGSGTSSEDRIDLGAVLRDAMQFSNLHALSLHAGWITDDDLAALARCAHFANLAELRIGRGYVSAEGMDVFLESPHFARLRSVHLPLNSHDPNDPIRARVKARFGEGVYSYY
jgi:uncharacterized protein (TIGR02996 family)